MCNRSVTVEVAALVASVVLRIKDLKESPLRLLRQKLHMIFSYRAAVSPANKAHFSHRSK